MPQILPYSEDYLRKRVYRFNASTEVDHSTLAFQANELRLSHLHILGHQALTDGLHVICHDAADVLQSLSNGPCTVRRQHCVFRSPDRMVSW